MPASAAQHATAVLQGQGKPRIGRAQVATRILMFRGALHAVSSLIVHDDSGWVSEPEFDSYHPHRAESARN